MQQLRCSTQRRRQRGGNGGSGRACIAQQARVCVSADRSNNVSCWKVASRRIALAGAWQRRRGRCRCAHPPGGCHMQAGRQLAPEGAKVCGHGPQRHPHPAGLKWIRPQVVVPAGVRGGRRRVKRGRKKRHCCCWALRWVCKWRWAWFCGRSQVEACTRSSPGLVAAARRGSSISRCSSGGRGSRGGTLY